LCQFEIVKDVKRNGLESLERFSGDVEKLSSFSSVSDNGESSFSQLRKFWAFDWILSLSSLIEEIIAKCGASRLKIFEIY
jgi:hypothetical protein